MGLTHLVKHHKAKDQQAGNLCDFEQVVGGSLTLINNYVA
jgi:hypothetical protein